MELLVLDSNAENNLTECKQMCSGFFEMLLINYSLTNHIYSMYMYKLDLPLNKLQGLICHKTQPTLPISPVNNKKENHKTQILLV